MPRPKPGRKPLPADQSNDRRRVQNRLAQRNFRDKRQQKLSDCVKTIEENRQQYQEEIREMARRHGEEKKALEDQIKELRRKNKELGTNERRMAR